MSDRATTEIIIALNDQRQAVAHLDVDPRLREEVDHLIAQAIVTLDDRRTCGPRRNVVGS